jgi:peroxin-6
MQEEEVVYSDSLRVRVFQGRQVVLKQRIIDPELYGFILTRLSAHLESPETDLLCVVPLPTLRRLGCQSASWVRLYSTDTQEKCFGLIVAHNFVQDLVEIKKDQILISCAIAFHLGFSQRMTQSLEESDVVVEPWSRSAFQVCNRAVLSRVHSPDSSGFSDYADAIRHYFQDLRILWEGMVFPVRASAMEYVFFKCVSIEGHEHGFVHPEITSLETEGSVSSSCPYPLGLSWQKFTKRSVVQSLVKSISSVLKCGSYGQGIRILLHGPRRSGKRNTLKFLAHTLGFHYFEVNAFNVLEPTDKMTSQNLLKLIADSSSASPVVFHLRRIEAFALQSNAQAGLSSSGSGKVSSDHSSSDAEITGVSHCFRSILEEIKRTPLSVSKFVFVASCESISSVHTSLQCLFSHQISFLEVDDEDKVRIMTELGITPSTSQVLAGMTVGEIRSLAAESKFEQSSIGKCAQHILSRRPEANFISSASIPSVRWQDIGGLENVKREIMDVFELPKRHASMLGIHGVKPRTGLLLYGPPGTGKTLVAKAVATECSFNFLSVKGPELLNMYVGQSEANVREVFEKARAAKPCVLFMDELDSLAPFRGRGSDSGGVSDRVVSQLLTEFDSIQSTCTLINGVPDVFVLGATNRPDLLDPALLRPGRLDKCIYLGVSSDKSHQVKILKALTRKFCLEPHVSLEQIAEQCTGHLTGADMYALCSDAYFRAMNRKISVIQSELEKTNPNAEKPLTANEFISNLPQDQRDVLVSQEDFLLSISNLKPSVSETELQHYEQLRQRFSSS